MQSGYSSEEDEDLRTAIRLSLQQDPKEKATADDVITISDDDPEDSIAERVQANYGAIANSRATEKETKAIKRKAEDLLLEEDEKTIRKGSKLKADASSEVVEAPTYAKKTATGNSSNELNVQDLPFPTGTVKRTWAFGFSRDDDVKIEEVLQRHKLQLGVLSSFQWDIDWLLSKVSVANTKLVLVMQAKEESTRHQYLRETASMPFMKLCFPPMPGAVNCMHSKLMLLSFGSYLRVVVPSANLVPYDWGETGKMENSVFIIDLPRLATESDKVDTENVPDFQKSLIYFCQAMGLDEKTTQALYRFDFSATHSVAFVHSIGGQHTSSGDGWKLTGYCGLGRAVRQLGMGTEDPIEIDFVASSLGAITVDFLSTLYLAAQGDEGTKELGWRAGSSSRPSTTTSNLNKTREAAFEAVRRHFRIYFPSSETVLHSRGGPASAGTVCFQKRWHQSAKFPSTILRDCKSARQGMLMHNKILYVRPADSSLGAASGRSWAYIGSANCSESAWGKLTFDKSSKTPKLNCRNWESGVIVPVPERLSEYDQRPRCDTLDVFRGVVPIVMELPGASMVSKTPWFFTEIDNR